VNINDITSLELELTSRCNAACSLCPRVNHYFSADLKHNREITVENLKNWLPQELRINLKKLILKGTFSDPLVSRHLLGIIEWFNNNTSVEQINIHTNGSLRNKKFWQWLAINLPKKSKVTFGIDGLQDTHSLYRVNTDFNKIINNATTFIESGGNAIWQFIEFEHNKHQIEDCKLLADKLKFSKFFVMDNDRVDNDASKKQIANNIVDKKVICRSLTNKEIFINWDGEVFPCCMTGIFSTKTKNYFDFVKWKNLVLREDFTNNNLNNHTLEEILQFYDRFYQTVETNPNLRVCGKYCGIK
jgi:MoaA/NifB/PqqE/SkfB family radical SAM enzyme